MVSKSKPIIIVSASPDNEVKFKDSYLYRSVTALRDIEPTIQFSYFVNNKIGLSQLYNRFLTPEFGGYIVVFVHDDVSIQDLMFVRKLQVAHGNYNIVGLAGGDGARRPYDKPLWHLMSNKRYGAVAHPTEPDQAVTVANFGPSPRPCKYIDGLFISIDVSAILDLGIQFDPQFDFHFYDLALCEIAKQRGATVGTWPIWVVHQGLGDSYQSASWLVNSRKFVSKYLTT